MPINDRVIVDLDVNTQKLEAGVRRSRESLGGLNKEADQTNQELKDLGTRDVDVDASRATASINKLGESSQRTGAAIAGISAGIAAVGTAAFARGIGAIVSSFGELTTAGSNAINQFRGMGLSADQAADRLNDLRLIAFDTASEVSQVAQGFTLIRPAVTSLGLTAGQADTILRGFAQAANFAGASTSDLEAAYRALTKSVLEGVPDLGAVVELSGRMPQLFDAAARAARDLGIIGGSSVRDLVEAFKSGEVSGHQYAQVMLRAASETENLTKSNQTAGDGLARVQAALAGVVFSTAITSEGSQNLSGAINDLANQIEASTPQIIKATTVVVTILDRLLKVIELADSAVSGLGTLFAGSGFTEGFVGGTGARAIAPQGLEGARALRELAPGSAGQAPPAAVSTTLEQQEKVSTVIDKQDANANKQAMLLVAQEEAARARRAIDLKQLEATEEALRQARRNGTISEDIFQRELASIEKRRMVAEATSIAQENQIKQEQATNDRIAKLQEETIKNKEAADREALKRQEERDKQLAEDKRRSDDRVRDAQLAELDRARAATRPFLNFANVLTQQLGAVSRLVQQSIRRPSLQPTRSFSAFQQDLNDRFVNLGGFGSGGGFVLAGGQIPQAQYEALGLGRRENRRALGLPLNRRPNQQDLNRAYDRANRQSPRGVPFSSARLTEREFIREQLIGRAQEFAGVSPGSVPDRERGQRASARFNELKRDRDLIRQLREQYRSSQPSAIDRILQRLNRVGRGVGRGVGRAVPGLGILGGILDFRETQNLINEQNFNTQTFGVPQLQQIGGFGGAQQRGQQSIPQLEATLDTLSAEIEQLAASGGSQARIESLSQRSQRVIDQIMTLRQGGMQQVSGLPFGAQLQFAAPQALVAPHEGAGRAVTRRAEGELSDFQQRGLHLTEEDRQELYVTAANIGGGIISAVSESVFASINQDALEPYQDALIDIAEQQSRLTHDLNESVSVLNAEADQSRASIGGLRQTNSTLTQIHRDLIDAGETEAAQEVRSRINNNLRKIEEFEKQIRDIQKEQLEIQQRGEVRAQTLLRLQAEAQQAQAEAERKAEEGRTAGNIVGSLFGAAVSLIPGAGPALAPVVSSLATAGTRALVSRQEGGYTGFGAPNQVAGVVHAGEFVLPQGVARAVVDGREVTINGGNQQSRPINVFVVRSQEELMQAMQSQEGENIIVDTMSRVGAVVNA